MAALVLKMSVSLDGYVAPPDGSGGWIAAGGSEETMQWTLDVLAGAGAHLMGATTYSVMANHWPSDDGPFAEPMNDIPKVVFSSSLPSAPWNETSIVRGDLSSALRELKAGPGRYLLAHGGARFARSLVETGLVDEYRLMVHPVVLGGGEPLFPVALDLVPISTTAFDGGCVAHVFATRSIS